MIIETLYPKSTDGIIEYDVIKLAAIRVIEKRMMKLISLMKADSHIQTMTPETLASLSKSVLGVEYTDNEAFLERINGDSIYTEKNFHDEFYGWAQDSNSYYKLTRDVQVERSGATSIYKVYMTGVGTIETALRGIFAAAPLSMSSVEINSLILELKASSEPIVIFETGNLDDANLLVAEINAVGKPVTYDLMLHSFTNQGATARLLMPIWGVNLANSGPRLTEMINAGLPQPALLNVPIDYMESTTFLNAVASQPTAGAVFSIRPSVVTPIISLESEQSSLVSIDVYLTGVGTIESNLRTIFAAAPLSMSADEIDTLMLKLKSTDEPTLIASYLKQSAADTLVAKINNVVGYDGIDPEISTIVYSVPSEDELYDPAIITDVSQTSDVNVLWAYLYGLDAAGNEAEKMMEAELFFQNISYKMPANIDVRFTIGVDSDINSVYGISSMLTLELNAIIE